jgi:hypothetical protein
MFVLYFCEKRRLSEICLLCSTGFHKQVSLIFVIVLLLPVGCNKCCFFGRLQNQIVYMPDIEHEILNPSDSILLKKIGLYDNTGC